MTHKLLFKRYIVKYVSPSKVEILRCKNSCVAKITNSTKG